MQHVARKFTQEEIIPKAAYHDQTGEVTKHMYNLSSVQFHIYFYLCKKSYLLMLVDIFYCAVLRKIYTAVQKCVPFQTFSILQIT